MFLGSIYAKIAKEKNLKFFNSYIIVAAVFILSSFLAILLGGDFGSAIIMLALFTLMILYIPSKEPNLRTIKMFVIVFGIIGVLGLKFGYLLGEEFLSKDYRLNRFYYINPCDRYEESSGYQVCNGFIAMDNGGLTGLGPGGSIQKYLYLPESHTDFIFPIIIEEFGLIFGAIIFIAYIAIIVFILKTAVRCYELQNQIICYGVATYLMLHIFVNLGGVLGVIPLTGVPLPFLSYGGSFCFCSLCSLAIVQRINAENEYTRRLKEFQNKKNNK